MLPSGPVWPIPYNLTSETPVQNTPASKTRPMDAIRSVIDSPDWGTNVLWLSLGVLLQGVFIGHIAVLGWGSELIQNRTGLPGRPTHDVNPDRIGDYVQQGIWPFLVAFVLQMILSLLMFIPLGIMFFGVLIASAGNEAAGGLGMIILFPLVVVLSLLMCVAIVPFIINAMICQDFKKAFDIAWARHFVSIMFWEIVVSGFIYYCLSFCVSIAGLLLFCVGIIPAQAIINGGAMHMLSQWYEIFLERGGRPIEPAGGPIIQADIV